jgi:hypothetical protein
VVSLEVLQEKAGPRRKKTVSHVQFHRGIATQAEIEWRLEGFMDCLNGIALDGMPDPKFVEWVADRLRRDVPAYPTAVNFLAENRRLRKRVDELEQAKLCVCP